MKQMTTPGARHKLAALSLIARGGVIMATYLGVDFHARQQTLAWCDTRDGEVHEQQLSHLSTELVEAANNCVRSDEELGKLYRRLLHRREPARAKVAAARRLLVRAFIMLRDEIDYAEFLRRGVAVRSARTVHRPEVPVTLIERPASGQ
jgi:hypothetical protein